MDETLKQELFDAIRPLMGGGDFDVETVVNEVLPIARRQRGAGVFGFLDELRGIGKDTDFVNLQIIDLKELAYDYLEMDEKDMVRPMESQDLIM